MTRKARRSLRSNRVERFAPTLAQTRVCAGFDRLEDGTVDALENRYVNHRSQHHHRKVFHNHNAGHDGQECGHGQNLPDRGAVIMGPLLNKYEGACFCCGCAGTTLITHGSNSQVLTCGRHRAGLLRRLEALGSPMTRLETVSPTAIKARRTFARVVRNLTEKEW